MGLLLGNSLGWKNLPSFDTTQLGHLAWQVYVYARPTVPPYQCICHVWLGYFTATNLRCAVSTHSFHIHGNVRGPNRQVERVGCQSPTTPPSRLASRSTTSYGTIDHYLPRMIVQRDIHPISAMPTNQRILRASFRKYARAWLPG